MDKLRKVIDYLRTLPADFYGEVVVKVKNGIPVLITEARTLKLDDDQPNNERKRAP